MSAASALGRSRSTPEASAPIVFVVDDDISVRESLELLIRAEGWQPETFASAKQFLDRPRAAVPNCLVLDISLPGSSGLELQERIASDIHPRARASAQVRPRRAVETGASWAACDDAQQRRDTL